ncbi:MAG: histidine kinase [Bacteroidia bacterium]
MGYSLYRRIAFILLLSFFNIACNNSASDSTELEVLPKKYFGNGDSASFNTLDSLKRSFIIQGKTKYLIETYLVLANNYFLVGRVYDALEQLHTLEDFYFNEMNDEQMSKLYMLHSLCTANLVDLEMDNYCTALDYATKSVSYLKKSGKPINPNEASKQYTVAISAALKCDLAKAESLLEEARKRCYKTEGVWCYLEALIERERKNYAREKDLMFRAIELSDENYKKDLKHELSVTYRKLKEFEKSDSLILEYRNENAENRTKYWIIPNINLGNNAFEQQNFEKATKYYDIVLNECYRLKINRLASEIFTNYQVALQKLSQNEKLIDLQRVHLDFIKSELKTKKNAEVLWHQKNLKIFNLDNQLRMEHFKRKNNFQLFALAILILIIIFGLLFYRQKKKNYSLKIEQSQTKIQMLNSQFTPHFTFNALNTIVSLITLKKYDQAIDCTEKFANLTRTFLHNIQFQFVDLDSEINSIKNYYNIEKIRLGFKSDLIVKGIETPEIKNWLVPPGIFQPIVENSVLHSLPQNLETQISVECLNHGSYLEVTISDNGEGFDLQHAKYGLGINMVKNKMQQYAKLYHLPYDFRVTSEISNGTKAIFKFPKK